MESWKTLLISLAFISLFAFAILNFGYQIQTENNANQSILDDSTLSAFNTTLTENLEEVKESSDTYWNASADDQQEEQNPEGALSLSSIFHSITTFGGFVLDGGSSIISILGRLGVGTIVLNVLIGILIITSIIVFWRLYKVAQ